MALTRKQETFAAAVLAGMSNKDAAITAGYSAKSASAAGSRLAKDPAVVSHLAKSRAVPSATVEPVPEPATVTSPAKPFDLKAMLTHADPKDFLLAAMNDLELDAKQRIDAAKALMPFTHAKLGEGGKKDQKHDAAKVAAQGRFSTPPPPPRLVSGGNK